METIEREYIKGADPVGTVPMPGTMKGAFKSAKEKLSAHHPETLINKLGERLAYERAGVRLYDAFITKCENANETVAVPLDQVRVFRTQEDEHFHIVKEAIESLGADPTAQTPDADVSGVAAKGLQQVISDPRTSVAQSLQAMLTVELTDHAAWDLLIKLAEDMGLDDMVADFTTAYEQEEVHLACMREWYEDAVLSKAGA